ncbi:MAG: hypothetical protein JSS62_01540 [Verrucomicrobia bacterium]|nr:hypothetical protein [Verrucomicrobiota bacterium]MBS0646971.1 hypothetical protein [Verrucomicrobiota bacterium]
MQDLLQTMITSSYQQLLSLQQFLLEGDEQETLSTIDQRQTEAEDSYQRFLQVCQDHEFLRQQHLLEEGYLADTES